MPFNRETDVRADIQIHYIIEANMKLIIFASK